MFPTRSGRVCSRIDFGDHRGPCCFFFPATRRDLSLPNINHQSFQGCARHTGILPAAPTSAKTGAPLRDLLLFQTRIWTFFYDGFLFRELSWFFSFSLFVTFVFGLCLIFLYEDRRAWNAFYAGFTFYEVPSFFYPIFTTWCCKLIEYFPLRSLYLSRNRRVSFCNSIAASFYGDREI